MTFPDCAPDVVSAAPLPPCYAPCPMLPTSDGAVGWLDRGKPVEFHEHFAAQAADHMPAGAVALPGIVSGNGCVILQAGGEFRNMLPPTPLTWEAGDCRLAVYRAPAVALSVPLDFWFARWFGWRLAGSGTDALFVLERGCGVAVPAGVVLPPLESLPILSDDEVRDVLDAAGGESAVEACSDHHDPVATWHDAKRALDRGHKLGVLIPETCPADPFERDRAIIERAKTTARDAINAAKQAPTGAPTTLPEPPERPEDELFAELAQDVPGLLGEVVNWIVSNAMYPQPTLALGAALTLVGTAAGRRYRGPTSGGSHLYVAALSGTGSGKDFARNRIVEIMHASGMKAHVGPGSFKSASALTAMLKRKPLALCPIDELGEFFGRVNGKNAGAWLSEVSGEFRKLWSSDYKSYQLPEWKDTPGDDVHSPAVSLYGTGTAGEFFDALTSGSVSNGLLNRFTFLIGRDNVLPRMVEPNDVIPESIIEGVRQIYCGGIVGNMAETPDGMGAYRNDPNKPTNLIDVPFGPGALEIFLEAQTAARLVEESRAEIYSRVAEQALRIALIRACGINPAAPVISVADMRWAIRLVNLSAKSMFSAVKNYVSDNANQAAYKMVLNIIAKGKKRGVTRTQLTTALSGRLKARELDDVIGLLEQAEKVSVVTSAREGNSKPIRTYYAL